MPQPRLIRPNATYAISRRTQDRRFLLRPDPILNALFVWVLAVTAAQCRVEVHVATVMSSHFHLVVTAPYENVSRFMQLLDCRLANALEVLRRLHRAVVWAPGELSIVELETTAAVAEQIADAIVNPVKAGLVFASGDWPGVTASVAQLGELVLTALRPAFYFVAASWPAIASIRFTLPTALIELGEEWARAWLEAEVARQEAEARAHVKAMGWRVPGKVAAQNVSPYERAKSWEELGKLAPHIAAGRGQADARKAAIARLRAFRADYRDALARWVAGDRDVVFPAGSYWMRVHHGAKVAPFG